MLNKVLDDDDNYKTFINYPLVNKLKKYSILITIITLIIFLAVIFLNILLHLPNKNFLIFNTTFFSLFCIGFLLVANKENHHKKYLNNFSKLFLALMILNTSIFLLSLLNLINLSFYFQFGKLMLLFIILNYIGIIFLLYSLIYKKYYAFAQFLALLLIVGRFVAFAINYVNINLNGMVLLFTLSSYLIISFLFLAYTPDKGFMKHLNLKTKNSVFGRNIFIIGNIFVLVLTVILIIKSAWFTFLSNELFLILSSVLFLIFLVFYYINHITYAEFNHIQSEEEAEKKTSII